MSVRDLLRNRGKQIDSVVDDAVNGTPAPAPLPVKKKPGLKRSTGGYTSANAPWLRKKKKPAPAATPQY